MGRVVLRGPEVRAAGSARHEGSALEHVAWDDAEFVALRDAQQDELAERYGEDDIGRDMSGDGVLAAVVARVDGVAAGCGALRVAAELGAGVGELKRMYVSPGARRRGVGRAVLLELERVAAAHGLTRLVLETGARQPEALGMYAAAGYLPIERYGEYAEEPGSICLGRSLA